MSNNLVVVNKELESKVDGLSKFSLEMANAIEKMNGAVRATGDVVAGLKPYIENYMESSIQSVREEMTTKIAEVELRQQEKVVQAIIQQNDIIAERKKKLNSAFESCVFRLLECGKEDPKYILFHKFIRAYLNSELRNWFDVNKREAICNNIEKYEKALLYLKKVKIPEYNTAYNKWCKKLAKSYRYGFDNLKSGSREEMKEAYELYFGITKSTNV